MKYVRYIEISINFLFLFLLFLYIHPSINLFYKINIKSMTIILLFITLNILSKSIGFCIITNKFSMETFKIKIISMAINEAGIKGKGDIYSLKKIKNLMKKKYTEGIKIIISERIIEILTLIYTTLIFLLKYGYLLIIAFLPFYIIKKYWKQTTYCLLLCVSWICEGISIWYILKMLQYPFVFYKIMLLVLTYTIIESLFLISAIGIREIIFILFATLISAPVEYFFVSSLILRGAYILDIIILLLFLKIKK